MTAAKTGPGAAPGGSPETVSETGPATGSPPGLLNRGFLAWLAATTISATGDGVLYFAIAWTASGYGADTVTLVLIIGMLPRLLLTLVGGAAADRWGLRRTIIGCNLAMCALLAAYLLITQLTPETGALQRTGFLLAALALAEGVINSFYRPANNAFPRLFFPESQVPRAMSLTGSTMEIARIAGPPLGAVLVVALSMTGAVLADLLSFVVVVAVLVAVRPPYEPTHGPAAAGSASAWAELRAGLRAVRRVPGVGAMLMAAAIVAGSLIPLLSLCVPLLVRDRGWSARDAGLIEASWIIGALGVSLVVAKTGSLARVIGPLAAGPVLVSVGIVVAVVAPVPWIAFAGAGLMGIGTAVFTRHLFPLYLLQTPDGMLARFQSVLIVAQFVAMFAGNAWQGGLAGRIGPAPTMLLAACVCACASAAVLASDTLRKARTD